jgi:mercuric ion transport protein
MSTKNESVALVGVGVAACAACCAGPILGFLAAIGLGAAIGVALLGTTGLVIAAIVVIVLVRRRRKAVACTGSTLTQVDISIPTRR